MSCFVFTQHTPMKLKRNDIILLATTLIAVVAVFQLPPIGQPPAFHLFADGRTILGIRNFWNVCSNLPFLVIAIYGFITLGKRKNPLATNLIYSTLFLGVALTAFGSGYYHSNPNSHTLVWDRMPLTIIFISFTCAIIADFINERLGLYLLGPLVLTGVGSVLWWDYTQTAGHGDLRLYMLVQYYPMVAIPLILWLYYRPSLKPMIGPIVWVVVWYVIAKLFERWDLPIYKTLGISGHTLKHLAAAASTWYFIEVYKRSIPATPAGMPAARG